MNCSAQKSKNEISTLHACFRVSLTWPTHVSSLKTGIRGMGNDQHRLRMARKGRANASAWCKSNRRDQCHFVRQSKTRHRHTAPLAARSTAAGFRDASYKYCATVSWAASDSAFETRTIAAIRWSVHIRGKKIGAHRSTVDDGNIRDGVIQLW